MAKYKSKDDEKKQNTKSLAGSKDEIRERRFYVTKEMITKLEKDDKLLKKLQKSFTQIKADLTFENHQIVIRQVHLDNERVLKMVQDDIGGPAFSEAEFARLVEDLTNIEHSRKELMADPAATFSNFLATSQKGAMFQKHETNKSRKQWFLLKGDRLYWRDKEKGNNHLNRSMEMKTIMKVRPGKTTRIFKSKYNKKISDDHCFSVVGVRKTVDLQCKSRGMRDEWFTYITFTHRHYVPAKRKTMYLEEADNDLNDFEDID